MEFAGGARRACMPSWWYKVGRDVGSKKPWEWEWSEGSKTQSLRYCGTGLLTGPGLSAVPGQCATGPELERLRRGRGYVGVVPAHSLLCGQGEGGGFSDG